MASIQEVIAGAKQRAGTKVPTYAPTPPAGPTGPPRGYTDYAALAQAQAERDANIRANNERRRMEEERRARAAAQAAQAAAQAAAVAAQARASQPQDLSDRHPDAPPPPPPPSPVPHTSASAYTGAPVAPPHHQNVPVVGVHDAILEARARTAMAGARAPYVQGNYQAPPQSTPDRGRPESPPPPPPPGPGPGSALAIGSELWKGAQQIGDASTAALYGAGNVIANTTANTFRDPKDYKPMLDPTIQREQNRYIPNWGDTLGMLYDVAQGNAIGSSRGGKAGVEHFTTDRKDAPGRVDTAYQAAQAQATNPYERLVNPQVAAAGQTGMPAQLLTPFLAEKALQGAAAITRGPGAGGGIDISGGIGKVKDWWNAGAPKDAAVPAAGLPPVHDAGPPPPPPISNVMEVKADKPGKGLTTAQIIKEAKKQVATLRENMLESTMLAVEDPHNPRIAELIDQINTSKQWLDEMVKRVPANEGQVDLLGNSLAKGKAKPKTPMLTYDETYQDIHGQLTQRVADATDPEARAHATGVLHVYEQMHGKAPLDAVPAAVMPETAPAPPPAAAPPAARAVQPQGSGSLMSQVDPQVVVAARANPRLAALPDGDTKIAAQLISKMDDDELYQRLDDLFDSRYNPHGDPISVKERYDNSKMRALIQQELSDRFAKLDDPSAPDAVLDAGFGDSRDPTAYPPFPGQAQLAAQDLEGLAGKVRAAPDPATRARYEALYQELANNPIFRVQEGRNFISMGSPKQNSRFMVGLDKNGIRAPEMTAWLKESGIDPMNISAEDMFNINSVFIDADKNGTRVDISQPIRHVETRPQTSGSAFQPAPPVTAEEPSITAPETTTDVAMTVGERERLKDLQAKSGVTRLTDAERQELQDLQWLDYGGVMGKHVRHKLDGTSPAEPGGRPEGMSGWEWSEIQRKQREAAAAAPAPPAGASEPYNMLTDPGPTTWDAPSRLPGLGEEPYTFAQAAHRLDIDEREFRKLVKSGKITSSAKNNGNAAYTNADLQAYIDQSGHDPYANGTPAERSARDKAARAAQGNATGPPNLFSSDPSTEARPGQAAPIAPNQPAPPAPSGELPETTGGVTGRGYVNEPVTSTGKPTGELKNPLTVDEDIEALKEINAILADDNNGLDIDGLTAYVAQQEEIQARLRAAGVDLRTLQPEPAIAAAPSAVHAETPAAGAPPPDVPGPPATNGVLPGGSAPAPGGNGGAGQPPIKAPGLDSNLAGGGRMHDSETYTPDDELVSYTKQNLTKILHADTQRFQTQLQDARDLTADQRQQVMQLFQASQQQSGFNHADMLQLQGQKFAIGLEQVRMLSADQKQAVMQAFQRYQQEVGFVHAERLQAQGHQLQVELAKIGNLSARELQAANHAFQRMQQEGSQDFAKYLALETDIRADFRQGIQQAFQRSQQEAGFVHAEVLQSQAQKFQVELAQIGNLSARELQAAHHAFTLANLGDSQDFARALARETDLSADIRQAVQQAFQRSQQETSLTQSAAQHGDTSLTRELQFQAGQDSRAVETAYTRALASAKAVGLKDEGAQYIVDYIEREGRTGGYTDAERAAALDEIRDTFLNPKSAASAELIRSAGQRPFFTTGAGRHVVGSPRGATMGGLGAVALATPAMFLLAQASNVGSDGQLWFEQQSSDKLSDQYHIIVDQTQWLKDFNDNLPAHQAGVLLVYPIFEAKHKADLAALQRAGIVSKDIVDPNAATAAAKMGNYAQILSSFDEKPDAKKRAADELRKLVAQYPQLAPLVTFAGGSNAGASLDVYDRTHPAGPAGQPVQTAINPVEMTKLQAAQDKKDWWTVYRQQRTIIQQLKANPSIEKAQNYNEVYTKDMPYPPIVDTAFLAEYQKTTDPSDKARYARYLGDLARAKGVDPIVVYNQLGITPAEVLKVSGEMTTQELGAVLEPLLGTMTIFEPDPPDPVVPGFPPAGTTPAPTAAPATATPQPATATASLLLPTRTAAPTSTARPRPTSTQRPLPTATGMPPTATARPTGTPVSTPTPDISARSGVGPGKQAPFQSFQPAPPIVAPTGTTLPSPTTTPLPTTTPTPSVAPATPTGVTPPISEVLGRNVSSKGVRGAMDFILAPTARQTNTFDAPNDPRAGGGIHGGIDISMGPGVWGDPIHALVGGRVSYANHDDGYGNRIIITDKDGNQFYYGHMDDLQLAEGQNVTAGEIIGRIGRVGAAHSGTFVTAPHLHLQIKDAAGNLVDPDLFLQGWSSQPTTPTPVPTPLGATGRLPGLASAAGLPPIPRKTPVPTPTPTLPASIPEPTNPSHYPGGPGAVTPHAAAVPPTGGTGPVLPTGGTGGLPSTGLPPLPGGVDEGNFPDIEGEYAGSAVVNGVLTQLYWQNHQKVPVSQIPKYQAPSAATGASNFPDIEGEYAGSGVVNGVLTPLYWQNHQKVPVSQFPRYQAPSAGAAGGTGGGFPFSPGGYAGRRAIGGQLVDFYYGDTPDAPQRPETDLTTAQPGGATAPAAAGTGFPFVPGGYAGRRAVNGQLVDYYYGNTPTDPLQPETSLTTAGPGTGTAPGAATASPFPDIEGEYAGRSVYQGQIQNFYWQNHQKVPESLLAVYDRNAGGFAGGGGGGYGGGGGGRSSSNPAIGTQRQNPATGKWERYAGGGQWIPQIEAFADIPFEDQQMLRAAFAGIVSDSIADSIAAKYRMTLAEMHQLYNSPAKWENRPTAPVRWKA